MSDEPRWPDLSLASVSAAWEASPTLIVLTSGPQHLVAYQNPASRALFGERPLGVPAMTAFPELSEQARSTLDRVLRTGEAVTQEHPRPGVLGQHGEEVRLTYVFAPVGEPGQPPSGVLLTALDVTAEVQASRASAQAEVLSLLSVRMNAAEDPNAALRQLTRTLVPAVADLAAVFVGPSAEAPGRMVALDLAPEVLARAGPPPDNPRDGRSSPWQQTLAAGRPVLVDVASGALADQTDAATAAWLATAGAHTMVVLPLSLAGELAGAVVLLAARPRAAYELGDLPFLELAAARAGAAISHVRLFRRQREIATDLQYALLPTVPEPTAGLEVAVRYLAGGADVEIGGDWWDIQPIGAGRTALGLGDVAGRGINAAIVMGQARSAMRAASLAELDPVAALTLLDRHLASVLDAPARLGTAPLPSFATAVYAVLDPAAQQLRVGNAGHPPLLVRRPDGRVERVHAPSGYPLGLGLGGYRELAVALPPGSIVLGFTDGLVERRAAGIEAGLHAVEDHLRSAPAGCDLEQLADGVLRSARQDHPLADDVALVAVRTAA